MIKKIWLFEHKIVYKSACIGYVPCCCTEWGFPTNNTSCHGDENFYILPRKYFVCKTCQGYRHAGFLPQLVSLQLLLVFVAHTTFLPNSVCKVWFVCIVGILTRLSSFQLSFLCLSLLFLSFHISFLSLLYLFPCVATFCFLPSLSFDCRYFASFVDVFITFAAG